MKVVIALGYSLKLLACEKWTLHHCVISERELLLAPKIWVSDGGKKAELKVMMFCNTVTLALTNKHDTVVGSSPRANHGTLTDGC